MIKNKLIKISEEYFLITHQDGTWEIIHEDRIKNINSPSC
ncbi:hypothetical protein MITS9509_02343 [Synechococcus sp. MIT S9509]|nr:hypothetical protein MITS9504_02165 [Synechococcus sp. MIT S9504]KZR91407.1 hypothetical protein MITS9509_02343 [Synechococcus sp. MIT S9509]